MIRGNRTVIPQNVVVFERKSSKKWGKNSLAHTKWECKYHIVFEPKYRRKVIYKQIRADIGHILSELCKRKGIEIIEAEACPDHIHMFVRIPPKYVFERPEQCTGTMLSSDWYHRKGTTSVPAHGGTCDSGFDYSRTLKERTTLVGERQQEQSAVYSDRL